MDRTGTLNLLELYVDFLRPGKSHVKRKAGWGHYWLRRSGRRGREWAAGAWHGGA
jgi:hypothetical protein